MSTRPTSPVQILMLVGDTIGRRRRTGVQRVVVESAKSLAGIARFDLVRWDFLEGGLRFLDAEELNDVFGPGDCPPGVGVRPQARRVGRPFHEQLDDPLSTWILAPEVAWIGQDGVDILSRALAHCRQWGGRFAAVFYDLIPIRNPAYADVAEPHEAYLAELVKADLIIPISRTAGDDLAALWRERGIMPHPPIIPLLLPDGGFSRGGRRAPGEVGRKIALVGTVEPRKRQIEVLKAMENARRSRPEMADWQVTVVGSLHPAVARQFNAIVQRNSWVTYRDYLSDQALDRTFREAAFTVFASEDEGYGLPISESLAAGAPCLCADFGSMAEIAAGGGCLTVNVRAPEALEAALIELCTNPGVLARLESEIAGRTFDDWAGYGRRLVDLMTEAEPAVRPAPVAIATAPPSGAAGLDDEAFNGLAAADIIRFADHQAIDDFLAEANRRRWPALLPELVLADQAQKAVDALALSRGARLATAERERAFAIARRRIRSDRRTRPIFLRLLISTYNRADFVVANVRWILSKVLNKANVPVELVVVDGGSSDDTVERLHQLYDHRLKIVECPTNVGMLAGLREAARAPGAEYIWLVGDDDFIDPKGFSAIVEGLKANAGLPFAVANFSVYHRTGLGPADTVGRLILEGHPVADAVAPDGVLPLRKIAEQTDNLFSAIYTIVWRADLLSAAFDHAFDGPPFQDLTQSIPSTEFMLEAYGGCDAYWRGRSAITGNAHNSWSRHRPRWHAVIMPLALSLAREVGVDPARLQSWADLHLTLLDEALEIARGQNWTTSFGSDHADLAQRVFRVRPHGCARS